MILFYNTLYDFYNNIIDSKLYLCRQELKQKTCPVKKEDHDIRHRRLPHEAHAHYPRRPSHDEFVRNVARLIIASMPARRHGVADIASSLSLGEQTFRRHIFAATGLTPKDFITSVQMREAARLLVDCFDVRIRDVGRRCGFDDASAFTNAFKKCYGMGPRQFRNLHNDEENDERIEENRRCKIYKQL